MLKFYLLLIVVTNLAICSYAEPIKAYQSDKVNTLQRDLSDFLDIIPIEQIRNLTMYFYANDFAMRQSYDYLRNDGYKINVENLSKSPLFIKLRCFLNETGIDYVELQRKIERVVLTNQETDKIIGNYRTF